MLVVELPDAVIVDKGLTESEFDVEEVKDNDDMLVVEMLIELVALALIIMVALVLDVSL